MSPARRYLGSFPCSAAGARSARSALKQFARLYLANRQLDDFETAIGEALANAVEHSAATKIAVACAYESSHLIAEIKDDGCGFFPAASVSRPPHDAVRGFGLFIMHQLLDEIEFLDGGRRLRLVMRVP